MSQSNEQVVCPWCQTEISWDPEIGPEESCPHCYNELGEYRSIKLQMNDQANKQPDEDELEEDDDFDDDDFIDPDEDVAGMDDSLLQYEENVQNCMDCQEETPECPSCHQFMLLAGTEQGSANTYKPQVNEWLGEPILPPFQVQVFVCPQCFRIDKLLSNEDKQRFIDKLNQPRS